MSGRDVSPLPQIAFETAFGSVAMLKAANKHGVDLDSNSGMAFVVGEDKRPTLVMLIDTSGTMEQIMALVAHEACHLAWRYFEIIGDENPSEEALCYAVDSFVYEAMKRFSKEEEGQ